MFLYFSLLYIASLFNAKARLLVSGQKTTLSKLKQIVKSTDHWVWFHAASVGEFEQGRPLIERYRQLYPGRRILLTFFSPSGYEMRKDYQGVDLVAYLPFATRRNARRMLQILPLEEVFFIKYEFWPAYLRALKKASIKTYLVSAIFHPKQAFFRWWGGWYRKLLHCFTYLFVQDEASRTLLADYGIHNVEVAGDTRFDRVNEICSVRNHIPQMDCFVEDGLPVIVAGSTWPADEVLLARFLQEHADVKLVVVPHEINEEHLHQIFQFFDGRYVRFSQATSNSLRHTKCLLIDNLGMLSQLYRYATVTYVGGGFGVGIHNLIEAAVYGKPVVFGPNYKSFREAHRLIGEGGGFTISNYIELCGVLESQLTDSTSAGIAAGRYVQSELGATEKILNKIKN